MTPVAHITECAAAIHQMKLRHVEGGNPPVTLAWPAQGGGPKPTRKPPAVRAYMYHGATHSVYLTAIESKDSRLSTCNACDRALELSRVAGTALALLSRSAERYRNIPRWLRDARMRRLEKAMRK